MERAKNISAAAIGALAVVFTAGCSGSTTYHLDPAQVALTEQMGAAVDDGEITLFESYVGVAVPHCVSSLAASYSVVAIDAGKLVPANVPPELVLRPAESYE